MLKKRAQMGDLKSVAPRELTSRKLNAHPCFIFAMFGFRTGNKRGKISGLHHFWPLTQRKQTDSSRRNRLSPPLLATILLQVRRACGPHRPRSKTARLLRFCLLCIFAAKVIEHPLAAWWNGRHDGFKIRCLTACRFKSGRGYQQKKATQPDGGSPFSCRNAFKAETQRRYHKSTNLRSCSRVQTSVAVARTCHG